MQTINNFCIIYRHNKDFVKRGFVGPSVGHHFRQAVITQAIMDRFWILRCLKKRFDLPVKWYHLKWHHYPAWWCKMQVLEQHFWYLNATFKVYK